ncbi:Trigger factor [Dissostichus eleginoides]|uniref:Trigger factor n=1 Tax=Dissostichus eleginoides TaxID=100907 RepID=A0AAD9CEG6_DISEL|nr:Trigger factor [Dissostichus eleginoides]
MPSLCSQSALHLTTPCTMVVHEEKECVVCFNKYSRSGRVPRGQPDPARGPVGQHGDLGPDSGGQGEERVTPSAPMDDLSYTETQLIQSSLPVSKQSGGKTLLQRMFGCVTQQPDMDAC